MDDPKIIGSRIRQSRCGKRLTQVELATAIGVSRAHLTNVENGKGALALDKLSTLATETGTTVAWLIGEVTVANQTREEWLAAFDRLDADQRRAALDMVKAMMPRGNGENPKPSGLEPRGPEPPRPFAAGGRVKRSRRDPKFDPAVAKFPPPPA